MCLGFLTSGACPSILHADGKRQSYWYGGGELHSGRTWYGSRYGYIRGYDGSIWIVASEDFDTLQAWNWPNEEAWVERVSGDREWPYRLHYRNQSVRVKSGN